METGGSNDRAALNLNVDLVHELLVRFIADETKNAGFEKAVIGISGGVDSSVAAFLAAEALGKNKVWGIILPYKTSGKESVKDAEEVARILGIHAETVDISPMVDGYAAAHDIKSKVRLGNIMARSRMIVLYDVSARERGLVVGTSNKTELLIGYGTQFGDLACAINPLGDLYKTQIWQLAERLGVPKNIVQKKPTADLWPGQTDEDEIGFSYRELDDLLFAMYDERMSPEELVKQGHRKDTIQRVSELVRKNQFKRRPPLIAKVSYRTINVDFRYVRDWGM
ncbi:MAG TPA: NAD+ synthase [Bacteroidota bacterium]|nr:NAD+ synthase [Bacteroidota bacterium]